MVLKFTDVSSYKVCEKGMAIEMSDYLCKKCSAELVSDEIALHMNLFSRAAKEFLCLDCQAAYLNMERSQLEEVIERYHQSGTCVLFAKYE